MHVQGKHPEAKPRSDPGSVSGVQAWQTTLYAVAGCSENTLFQYTSPSANGRQTPHGRRPLPVDILRYSPTIRVCLGAVGDYRMIEGLNGQKQPADTESNAVQVAYIPTGEAQDVSLLQPKQTQRRSS